MQKKSILRIGLQLLAFSLAAATVNAATPAVDAVAKIQAAFWGIKPLEQGDQQLPLLQKAGINTALVCDVGYQVKTEMWRGWARLAEKHAIRLMPVLCFAGTEEIKNLQGQYRRFTNRAGVTSQAAPCPLDENYWQIAIGQRFAELARLSQNAAIAGLVFDTEMYGGDLAVYDDYCFCNDCWNRFMATLPAQPGNVSPPERGQGWVAPPGRGHGWVAPPARGPGAVAQRAAYLEQHGLSEAYARFQENRLQQILTPIAQQLHSLNPALALGFLAYIDNWFYHALIRGLGTAARPVLVFSETTYIRGYTPEVLAQQQGIKAQTTDPAGQPQALYIPGLWLGRFFPQDVAAQASALAVHTDGYWFFTADSFWITGEKKYPYDLHGRNEDYLAAFAQTRAELQRFAAAPAAYQSSFPALHPSSFYDAARRQLVTPPTLPHFLQNLLIPLWRGEGGGQVPVRKGEGGGQPTTPAPTIYCGTTLFHCLKNATDGPQTIQILHVPVGAPDPTTYQLFAADGSLLQEGRADSANRSAQLTIPANVAGPLSLRVDSGANAAIVTFPGLPCVVEASATFPIELYNSAQSYAAHVTPDQPALQLRAYSPAPQIATITVQPPDGAAPHVIAVTEYSETIIPAASVPPALAERPEAAPVSDQLTLRFQAVPPRPTPAAPKRPGETAGAASRNRWTIRIKPDSAQAYAIVRFAFYNAAFPYLLPQDLSE